MFILSLVLAFVSTSIAGVQAAYQETPVDLYHMCSSDAVFAFIE